MRSIWGRLLAIACAAALLTGCNRFASSDDADAEPTEVAVGSQDALDGIGSTRASTTPDGTPLAPDAPLADEDPDGSASAQAADTSTTSLPEFNTGELESVVERDGWLLSLKITPGDDTTAFTVFIENRSGTTRYLDTSRHVVAAIFDLDMPDTRWNDRSCGFGDPDPFEYPTGVLAVEDGETSRNQAAYPGNPDCALPAGDYQAVGYVSWCPDDQLFTTEGNGGQGCNEGGFVLTPTDPVRFSIA